MTISNWFAFALLLILSALTLCVFVYVGLSLHQWRRAGRQDREPPKSQRHPSAAQFELTAPVADRLTLGLEDIPELWAKLTRREKQVARLAASGMSDAEIAEELAIAERTVGNHLYKIYGKLEINSRRELKYLLRQVEDDS